MTQQEVDYAVDQIFDLIGKAQIEPTAELKGFYLNSVYVTHMGLFLDKVEKEDVTKMIHESLKRLDKGDAFNLIYVVQATIVLFSPTKQDTL